MRSLLRQWFLVAITGCLWIVQPSLAAGASSVNLVSVEWLETHLGRDDVLVLDASPRPMYAAKHIPGAVHADLFSFGAQELPPADMQRRLQAWGISPGKKIVLYDQDGLMWATRLFFDLYHLGFPVHNLLILNGGLSKWQASGRAVTKEPTPPPATGTFRITQRRDEVRVRLPEFLAATGDPMNHAVIEALEPSYHFGEAKFFDRAGHVPNAIMWPRADLFNADKTFKSAQDIQRMVGHLGIRPEQQIHTYCGGGVAASLPFFALKFILGYPNVKLYRESQVEWMRDDRGLPLWTYSAPFLQRDSSWLHAWGNPMIRSFGIAHLSVVDVRSPDAYRLGHVPFALSLPADVFGSHLAQPRRLAELLGPAGLDPAHEAVIVSEGGLTPASALAFLMLHELGQKKVSILMDSVDEWGLRGFALTKEATVVGAKKTPQDLSVPAVTYPAGPRQGVLITAPGSTQGGYPKVFIAAGRLLPTRPLEGHVIHLPYTELVTPGGTPKAAKDLWNILVKAGLPAYAEIICVSDDPGEAAVIYFVLKLMGRPDVKVWIV